MLRNPQSSS